MNLNFFLSGWISLLMVLSAFGQSTEEKYKKDVGSVDAIIDAYYEVISGTKDDPWQFERDQFIHSENAVITRLDENGYAETHSLEADYIPMLLAQKQDLFEIELKRVVTTYGNMAQVWSAFEVRSNPEVSTDIRGLNSIQLHFENGRWFIDSWTVQMESEMKPIVEAFLKEGS